MPDYFSGVSAVDSWKTFKHDARIRRLNRLIKGLVVKKLIVASLAGTLLLSSCADMTHQDTGVLTGGVVGGLIGSQFGSGGGKIASTLGGAVIGAYLGGAIGRTMDRLDRMEMQRALETAPTGRPVMWQNPDSGNRYTVVPTRTYYNNEQACREYTTRAIIGGKSQEVHGQACRESDGSWRVVS